MIVNLTIAFLHFIPKTTFVVKLGPKTQKGFVLNETQSTEAF